MLAFLSRGSSVTLGSRRIRHAYTLFVALNCKIRRARPAERRSLLQLWLALIDHHHELDPGYPHLARSQGDLREGLLAEVDRALANPRGLVLVAEDESGALVGFALSEHESGRGASIHELFVRGDRRRSGLGRELVEFTLEQLAERRPTQVSVRIEAANSDAQKFWSALNFRQTAHLYTLQT